MEQLAYLRLPMSLLLHMEHIDAFEGLSAERLAALPADYTADELKALVAALRFAVENPQHDFRALMPALPFTNEQIHVFLCKVFLSMTEPG